MKQSSDAVKLDTQAMRVAGELLVKQFASCELMLVAVAVASSHTHLLAELPRDKVKQEVGRAKRVVSFALRERYPGRLWARGCGIKPVGDRAYQLRVMDYILRHKAQGAWVWKWGDEINGDMETKAHT